jgi:AraC-like DNA-binding protein
MTRAAQDAMLEQKSAAPSSSHNSLTARSLITIDYLPVPHALADYVTVFYHFRCDEAFIRDIQPAAIGQLTLFPFGHGQMMFRDGRVEASHEVNLITPLSLAAPFEMQGPFHAIGAALSPLGWAALTRLCAQAHGNRLYAAGLYLGQALERDGSELCARYRAGDLGGEDCASLLGRWIGNHLKPVPPRHAKLIAETGQWLSASLNPAVEDLYRRLCYSPRQVQRLVEQYYGLPPRALARKYRALRAAALLSLPHLSDETEAQLAEAFYDQAHLTREIRLFVGRTPARLDLGDTPYLSEMLDLRNFREITCPPA